MASIRASHLWKRFTLRKDRADSVGQLLVRMIPGRQRPTAEPFWALRDVSFEMPAGTSLGIVGRNGSGKSTLLKILTRTMRPTQGEIAMQGRTSALIELGAGFHPDFTGRENIVLNASILGVRRREIERHMEEIIDFAEIRAFIDTPVKYYSSGMQARLGFSVAIHVEPDILIVDEVLAVGDEAFSQKCMQRIFELKRKGVSILLVSHDLSSVQRLMDRALWLDGGVLRASGGPRDVIHAYRASLEAAAAPVVPPDVDAATQIGLSLHVADAYVRVAGRRTENIGSGQTADFVVELMNETGCPVTGFLTLSVRRPDGLEVGDISGFRDGTVAVLVPGHVHIAVTVEELRLTAGIYEVDAAFAAQDASRRWDWKRLLTFRVPDTDGAAGIVLLPHRWRVG